MASKDTNSTIFTVALVGIGGYIAYKIFKNYRGSGSGSGGSQGVGGGIAPSYYPPYSDQGNQDNSLLGSLLAALLGGRNSASLGGGGGGGGKNNAGLGSGNGYGASSGGDKQDFLNSLVEYLEPSTGQPYDFSGPYSADTLTVNPEVDSNPSDFYLPSDSYASESDINALENSAATDVGGAFISDANDGSTASLDTSGLDLQPPDYSASLGSDAFAGGSSDGIDYSGDLGSSYDSYGDGGGDDGGGDD